VCSGMSYTADAEPTQSMHLHTQQLSPSLHQHCLVNAELTVLHQAAMHLKLPTWC
jgi:hypothetical protein